jgi:hypothetical protein
MGRVKGKLIGEYSSTGYFVFLARQFSSASEERKLDSRTENISAFPVIFSNSEKFIRLYCGFHRRKRHILCVADYGQNP